MFRYSKVPGAGVFAACLLIAGCVSPMDRLESAVEVERSVRRSWIADAESPRSAAAAEGRDEAERTEIHAESTLGECLRYALERNRGVEAAYLGWLAALEKSPQVTALPDPRLSYGYFLDEVETRVGPQQHRMALSQAFPWFGKLALRGQIAEAEAEAEYARFQGAVLELAYRVRTAFNELYYLRGEIDLTRENLKLLEQFERIARAKYRVGAGSHPDVVRFQIELGKLEDRLRRLEDKRGPLAARFNAVLDRPVDAEAPWPDSIADPDTEPDVAALASALAARNPELAALQHTIERHRLAADLARKDAYPDITLQLDYIVTDEAMDPSIPESGDDPLIIGASISVPLWREKYDAGVREALKRRLAAAAGRKETENRLRAELQLATFEHADARRKVELYRDGLVPKARESLDASISAYQTASVGFLDLLDAERLLLEMQLTLRRARADAANAMARIEQLVGVDLPDQAALTDAPKEVQ
ncbi:MAG: TolC family protein [Phycisphaerales bacterium]|nr:MAG: TolC family protein [Phycisphaerales bacterium]